MEHPLVSVVLPVYNGERYLASALDTVFAQDYAPFEVVVVDDGSTDRSPAIAQARPVRYLAQPNRGVAFAWNAGVAAAQGQFVTFLAQDDLWTPDKLRIQVSCMTDNPSLAYSVALMRCFLEPGCSLPMGFRQESLECDQVGRIPETLMARRWLFDSVGGFDTTLTSAHDVDWFARAKDAEARMMVIPSVLLHRRIHDANQTFGLGESNDQNLLRVLRHSIQRQRKKLG